MDNMFNFGEKSQDQQILENRQRNEQGKQSIVQMAHYFEQTIEDRIKNFDEHSDVRLMEIFRQLSEIIHKLFDDDVPVTADRSIAEQEYTTEQKNRYALLQDALDLALEDLENEYPEEYTKLGKMMNIFDQAA